MQTKTILMDPSFPDMQRALYDNMFVTPSYSWMHFVYDRVIYTIGNLRLRAIERFMASIIHRFQLKEKKVLDVGSHTGYNSFLFKVAGNEVFGIDISKHLDFARKRYAEYGIRFVSSDALQYLESNGSELFDFIFVCNFPAHYDTGQIEHSAYAEAFMKAALKKLSPQGRLYYAFYSTKHAKVANPVTEEAMRQALSKWGITHYQLGKSAYADGNELLELIIPVQ